LRDAAPLEAQQQADVEHFECVQVDGAACAQTFQANEKILAGQLVAEQHPSQRAAFPGVADALLRAQEDLVHGRAECIFGVVDVVRRGDLLLGAACEVVEELRHLADEVGVGLRAAAVLEHEQRIKAVVHQVHQRVRGVGTGRHAGGKGRLAAGNQ
jgi:hypothetical protein